MRLIAHGSVASHEYRASGRRQLREQSDVGEAAAAERAHVRQLSRIPRYPDPAGINDAALRHPISSKPNGVTAEVTEADTNAFKPIEIHKDETSEPKSGKGSFCANIMLGSAAALDTDLTGDSGYTRAGEWQSGGAVAIYDKSSGDSISQEEVQGQQEVDQNDKENVEPDLSRSRFMFTATFAGAVQASRGTNGTLLHKQVDKLRRDHY